MSSQNWIRTIWGSGREKRIRKRTKRIMMCLVGGLYRLRRIQGSWMSPRICREACTLIRLGQLLLLSTRTLKKASSEVPLQV